MRKKLKSKRREANYHSLIGWAYARLKTLGALVIKFNNVIYG